MTMPTAREARNTQVASCSPPTANERPSTTKRTGTKHVLEFLSQQKATALTECNGGLEMCVENMAD